MLPTYVVRRFLRQSAFRRAAKLSPEQVTAILERNEFSQTMKDSMVCAVNRVDGNHLAANSPCEDRMSEDICRHSNDYVVGVYDGHGGTACSQSVSRRLPAYIAASMLSTARVQRHLADLETGHDTMYSLLERFRTPEEDVQQSQAVAALELQSYMRYVRHLVGTPVPSDEPGRALTSAFQRLDSDLGEEALNTFSSSRRDADSGTAASAAAESGCVSCVAHVRSTRLHVASTGDCRAVLGVLGDHGRWIARPLTRPHDCHNTAEVGRIRDAHPSSERHLFRDDRLLGMLAPLRAFGDFRFKWSRDLQARMSGGADHIYPDLLTPPYLTAQPEISRHKLTPRDRFLVLASDGLWDELPADEVIQLIGQHALGKTSLSPFQPVAPSRGTSTGPTLAELNHLLEQRRRSLGRRPEDLNAATHLIRHALSGSVAGLNHGRIAHLLSVPPEVTRNFRDDITVAVIMFDTDYLRPN